MISVSNDTYYLGYDIFENEWDMIYLADSSQKRKELYDHFQSCILLRRSFATPGLNISKNMKYKNLLKAYIENHDIPKNIFT